MEPNSLYTADQLIAAADRLPDGELNEFVQQVIRLSATRRTPSLSARETELLKSIFADDSRADLERCQQLRNKRDAGNAITQELNELLSLSDRIEVIHAQRMAAIAELARLRGIGLSDMMTQLGVNLPENEL
jgi:hypothetical protein